MKFSDFSFQPQLQNGIESSGYSDCTPIQTAVIPQALMGRDIAGIAQTGTGKTAAFLIPAIERILRASLDTTNMSPEELAAHREQCYFEWKKRNFVLVLVPTRELADQIKEAFYKLRGTSSLECVAVYGGTGYEDQERAFATGVEFVIATPGRLIDLFKSHVVDLKQVRAVIFDEADRMFDMGFKDDMKFLLSRMPRERQFMVFSATLNSEVVNVGYHYDANPVTCDVSRDQTKAENVKDRILHIGSDEKPSFLLSLIRKEQPNQIVIFSNYKNDVKLLADFLTLNGLPALGISSLLSQAQRNRVIQQFKAENAKNILVATDVAARGLDIKGVDMVINYHLPDDAENYVHRIGRTGRAGAEGKAFSLVSERDVEALMRIEEYLKHKVEVVWLDDQDIVKEFEPLPREREFKHKPRGEGRDGGGGRDRDRDGNRGPRRDGGGRRDGNRDFKRGPRRDENRNAGDKNSQQSGRPPRTDGGKPRRDDRNSQRGPRHENSRHKNAQGTQKHTGRGGHKQGSAGVKAPAAAHTQKPNAIKKLTGFVKKLFGKN